MTKYLIQDLVSILKYASYGIIIGCVVYLLYCVCVCKRKRSQRKFALGEFLLCIYVAIMLTITFFSRESGGDKRIYLEIGSSWGINARNNAYVVENVLLFIPYGFLLPMAWKKSKGWWKTLLLGFLTSLSIEFLQLVSGRGVFQTDDIITNTMGAIAGYLFFALLITIVRIFKKDNCA